MKRSGRPFQSIGTRMRSFGRSILRSYLPPEQDASPEGAPPVPPPAWLAGAQVPLNWPEDAAPPAESPYEEPALSADQYLQQMSTDAAPPARPPAQPRPAAGQPVQRTPAQNTPRPSAAPNQPVQRQPAQPPARPKPGDSKGDARLLAILAAHQEQDAERERIREQRRKDLGDDIQRTAENPSSRRRRASFDYVETSSLKSIDKGETGSTSNETPSKPPAGDDDEDSSPAGSIQRTAAETSETGDAKSTASSVDSLRPDVAAAIAAAESPSGYTPGAAANPPPVQRAPAQPAAPADAAAPVSAPDEVQPAVLDNPSLARRSPANDDLPTAGNEAVQRSAADDAADDGEVWADGPFDAADVDDSFELPPQASLTDSPSGERISPPRANPPAQPPASHPDVSPEAIIRRNPAGTPVSAPHANPSQDFESFGEDAPPVQRRTSADAGQPMQRMPANEQTGWSETSFTDAPAIDAGKPAEPDDSGWTSAPDAAYTPADADDAPVDTAYYSSAEAETTDDASPADILLPAPPRASTAPPVQRAPGITPPQDTSPAGEGEWREQSTGAPAEASYDADETGWQSYAEADTPSWQAAPVDEPASYPADEPDQMSESVAPAVTAPKSPSLAATAPPVQRAPAEFDSPDAGAFEAPAWNDIPAEAGYADAGWQQVNDAEPDASAWQDTPFYSEPDSYPGRPNASPERPHRVRNTPPVQQTPTNGPPPVQRTPEDDSHPEIPVTDAPAWNDSPVEDSYSAGTAWQPTGYAESDAPDWQAAQFDEADSYAADASISYGSDAAPSVEVTPERPSFTENTPVQRTSSEADVPERAADAPAWDDTPTADRYAAADWQPTDDADTPTPLWQDAPSDEPGLYPADETTPYTSDERAAPAISTAQPPAHAGNPPPLQRASTTEAPAWDDAPAEDSDAAVKSGWQGSAYPEADGATWDSEPVETDVADSGIYSTDDVPPYSNNEFASSAEPATGQPPPVQRTPADSAEPPSTGWQESGYTDAGEQAGEPAAPGMDLYEALMAAGAWASERPPDYNADTPDATPRADAAPVQRAPSDAWNTADAGDEPYAAEPPVSDEEPPVDVFQALMAVGALPDTPAAPVTGRTGQPVQRTPSDGTDEPPTGDDVPESNEDVGSPEQSIDLYRALQAIGAVPGDSRQGAGSPPGSAIQRSPAADERAELERLLDLKPPPAANRPAPPTVEPSLITGPIVQRAASDSSDDDGGAGVDLDKLARDVYSVLRDRLRIERERRSKP
jgi:hypothetical protein